MPRVARSANPSSARRRAGKTTWRLSRFATETNTGPPLREGRAGGQLRLGQGGPEVGGDAHHLPGRAHLRPEDGVHAGEPAEREDRGLHRHVRQVAVDGVPAGGMAPSARSSARWPRPSPGRRSCRGEGRWPSTTNGTVREARGFASRTYGTSSRTASWTFSRPRTPRRRAMATTVASMRVELLLRECGGGDHAARVARSGPRPPRCAP